MNSSILTLVYGKAALCLVLAIVCLLLAVFKKRMIKWENAVPAKQPVMKKNEKKVNSVLRVLLLIGSVVFLVFMVIPAALDIPAVLKGDYRTVSGTVIQQDHGGRDGVEKRTVQLRDHDSGDTVTVHIYDNYIDEHEQMTVRYLPFTKYGERLQ